MSGVTQDTQDLVRLGMRAFGKYWEANATNSEMFETDSDGKPEFRNAQTAAEMLFNYIEDRKGMLRRDMILLEIEQPFAVPLDPDDESLVYVGRWDKVILHKPSDKRIIGIEHKTTAMYKKNGPFRNEFIDAFSPNSQIDGYLYSMRMRYGEKVKSIWVDASLVHKDINDGFRFLPVERLFAQVETWLWEVRYWIDQIEVNLEALHQYQVETDARKAYPGGHNSKPLEYMPAFPKNTVSCTQYGGCPYLDVCKMYANPETKEVPMGFIEKKWEPFDELLIADTKTFAIGKREVKRDELEKSDRIYDNTRVAEFRTCPRKYYFRHIRHWKPSEDRRPLLFGGAWHAAMDAIWEKLVPRAI